MSCDPMSSLKAAIVTTATRSEALEATSLQMAKNTCRAREGLNLRVHNLIEQVRTAGNMLVTQLEDHHKYWEEKLNTEQLKTLKHSMKLSMELASENVGHHCDNLELDLHGLDLDILPDLAKVTFCPGSLSVSRGDIGSLNISEKSLEEKTSAAMAKETNVTKGEAEILNKVNIDSMTDATSSFIKEVWGVDFKESSQLEILAEVKKTEAKKSTEVETVTKRGIMEAGSVTETVKIIDTDEEVVKVTEGRIETEILIETDHETDGDTLTETEELTLANSKMEPNISDNKYVDQASGSIVASDSGIDVLDLSGTKGSSAETLPPPLVGSLWVARWPSDGVWYRARVEELQGQMCLVTFVDYGNSDLVRREDMVASRENIPLDQRDLVDGFVSEEEKTDLISVEGENDLLSEEGETGLAVEEVKPGTWAAGMRCLAKWSEDFTWYNAEVVEKEGDTFTVLFTDYGNMAVVTHTEMLMGRKEIPEGDIIDTCVQSCESGEYNKSDVACAGSVSNVGNIYTEGKSEKNEGKNTNLDGEDVESIVWKSGMRCLARWSEDETWYRAEVVEKEGDTFTVLFTDYGNMAVVMPREMVIGKEEIPEGHLVDPCVQSCESVDVEKDKSDERLELGSVSTVDNSEGKGNECKNTNIDVKDVDPVVWKVGMRCLARWSEDWTWYNAEVVEKEGETFTVMFIDYGNMAIVTSGEMVKGRKEIPDGDLVDTGVQSCELVDVENDNSDVILGLGSESVSTVENTEGKDIEYKNTNIDVKVVEPVLWKVGMRCLARWSEDWTWYNAEVVEKEGETFTVLFINYGNMAIVTSGEMVKGRKEIPDGGLVDTGVQSCESVEVEIDESDVIIKKGSVSTVDNTEGKCNESKNTNIDVEDVEPVLWNVGMRCLARWSEDWTWYNAEVVEKEGETFTVLFTDYGNTALVTAVHMMLSRKDVPEGDLVDVCVQEIPLETGYKLTEKPQSKVTLKEGSVRETTVGDDEKIPEEVLSEPLHQLSGNTSGLEFRQVETGSFLTVGETCVALWTDLVWYNVEILHVNQETGLADVLFLDYENIDKVRLGDIFRSIADVPRDKMNGGVDPHVLGDASNTLAPSGHVLDPTALDFQPPFVDKSVPDTQYNQQHLALNVGTSTLSNGKELDLTSLMVENQPGHQVLPATQVVFSIKSVPGPLVLALLQEGTLVMGHKEENCVNMFTRDGRMVGQVSPGRAFQGLSDLTTLPDGGFVVMDRLGFQIFSQAGVFVRELVVQKLDTCRGLAVDELGRLVTINRCQEGDQGLLTGRGETDVLFINIESSKIEKRMQMEDIIEDKTQSDCHFLAVLQDKLFVVDTGLDRVYLLFKEDGEEQALVFGSTGPGEMEFNDPTGLAVDSRGNMIIADSRNHRLQVVSSDCEYVGLVKVTQPLSRPISVLLDKEMQEMIVHNYWTQEIIKYRLGQ